MKLCFNSSLPRSGSTLLQNILAQNPRIHASATSGVISLLMASRQAFSNQPEFKAGGWKQAQVGFLGYCRGGVEAYYSAITDKPVVVDKSRGWLGSYQWLAKFYQNPKILCCIRDLRGIISSMEKKYRQNSHLFEPNDRPAEMRFNTIDQRVTAWMNQNPVGMSLSRLSDACHRGFAPRVHFIRMEDMCTEPEKTFSEIYAYLEEEPFAHDFQNITQTVPEDDAHHHFYGDHQVHPGPIAMPKPDWNEVLGRQLSSEIVARNQWFYTNWYPKVIRPSMDGQSS